MAQECNAASLSINLAVNDPLSISTIKTWLWDLNRKAEIMQFLFMKQPEWDTFDPSRPDVFCRKGIIT